LPEQRRDAIRDAMSHAWKGYRTYAWGEDELKPESNRGASTFHNLGCTIVDSLSTLWIMDLRSEFDDAKKWVESNLNFDRPIEVSLFETTIRFLGGLVSAYDLSKETVFLNKAVDLADRLLWAFNTTTGIPYNNINLQTHQSRNMGWTGASSVLSEVGTLQLEFTALSRFTGNKVYEEKVFRVIQAIDQIPKPYDALCPVYVSPETGRFTNGLITLGALGDSYYEYLLKMYLFTRNELYGRMYKDAVRAIIKHLVKKSSPHQLTYVAELDHGGSNHKMDHLACFVGGMFGLGAWSKTVDENEREEHLKLGEGIATTCNEFYTRQATGISPEIATFGGNDDFYVKQNDRHYIQRPEAVEAMFYMWRFTHDQKYREWGWKIFTNFEKYLKTNSGYSGIRDVTNTNVQKDDQQQSFFMAETLKYLYLLFCDDNVIPLDGYVFNTEAHPVSIPK